MNLVRRIAQRYGYELEKPKIIELTLRAHLKKLFEKYAIDLVIDTGAKKGSLLKS